MWWLHCVRMTTLFALAETEERRAWHLALEVNRLAGTLQGRRAGALEAMALVERVMRSMQSPVLAFDPEGRLRLLNAAGERAFGLRGQPALGHSAATVETRGTAACWR